MRRWRESDRDPFAALNADPVVMRHFPVALSRAESDALVDRIEACFEEHGFGLWALEHASSGELLGFTGLAPVPPALPFAPAVEVGWRLAAHSWGQGYATEAARSALAFGFESGLPEIVSFTSTANARSRAVMGRVGMTREPGEDFDHPELPPDSPLRPHVLYRLAAPDRRAALPAGGP